MYLYLNSFGTYLHVKDAMFEVRVPDRSGSQTHHLAARKIKAIILTTAGAVSTDAIRLALEHHIDLVITDRSGQPLGRFWHSKLGSTTSIRRKQLLAGMGRPGLDYTSRWLAHKLERQAELLRSLRKHRKEKHREQLAATADRIDALRASIAGVAESATRVSEVADTLRGLEGTAGRLYWQALGRLLSAPYSFEGRSFRPALDPFNAFVNYGYGILYSRVERALMVAGLDPYVGFMHRDDYNQKSMVYDFIEPYRPWVDRVVMRLFTGKQVTREQYEQGDYGTQLLKPGKVLLVERLGDYLDGQTIRHGRRNRSRENALLADAHRLAQELLQTEVDQLQIQKL